MGKTDWLSSEEPKSFLNFLSFVKDYSLNIMTVNGDWGCQTAK